MDNKEDILDALEEFSNKRKHEDDIPAVLEKYLCRIAVTGEPMFPWSKLKPLFLHKLNQVVTRFEEKNTESPPPQPNVENAKVPEMKDRLNRAIDSFNGIPFTIQRLCELVTNPDSHYKKTDKFIRGVEKNIMVVSTIDPFGNRITVEPKHVSNGLDANGSFDESPTKLNVSLVTPVNSPAVTRVSARGDVGVPPGGVGTPTPPTAGGDAANALQTDADHRRLSEAAGSDVQIDSAENEASEASAMPVRRNSGGFEPNVSEDDSTPCDKSSRVECVNEPADSSTCGTKADSSGDDKHTTGATTTNESSDTETTATSDDSSSSTEIRSAVVDSLTEGVCDRSRTEQPIERETAGDETESEQKPEVDQSHKAVTSDDTSDPESTPPHTTPEVCPSSSDANSSESSNISSSDTNVSTSVPDQSEDTAMDTD